MLYPYYYYVWSSLNCLAWLYSLTTFTLITGYWIPLWNLGGRQSVIMTPSRYLTHIINCRYKNKLEISIVQHQKNIDNLHLSDSTILQPDSVAESVSVLASYVEGRDFESRPSQTNKGSFTVLTLSHPVAHFHMSAASIIQRYHLCHRHERDVAYDGAWQHQSSTALNFQCERCWHVKACYGAWCHQKWNQAFT